MRDLGRILYATDFSPASQVAFPHALRLARVTGAELTILHVLPSPVSGFIGPAYVPPETWDDLHAEVRGQADRAMDRLIAQAVEAGVRASAAIVEGGDVPGDEIVRVARDAKADMIVVGTHGRTGIAKALLGSVASRVVATATCPVLTVRAPEPGEGRP